MSSKVRRTSRASVRLRNSFTYPRIQSASRKQSGPGAVSIELLSFGTALDFSPSLRRIRTTMQSCHISTLLTILLFVCLLTPCRAEDANKVFAWGFGGPDLSTELPSCRSIPINILRNVHINTSETSLGIPPYFMGVFAIGGTPSVTPIGSNASSLSWTVDQPIGTKLLLTVFDGTGSSGGVPPLLYEVVAGSTTQCSTPASTEPAFTVTANVTDSLATCAPWGLTIVGGQPPYNITIAALNSPVITNVTMGPNFDQFTYINRAEPASKLIAAVSDVNGRWATGTPIVTTVGSTNADCPGLNSVPGHAAAIQAQQKAALNVARTQQHTLVVAGVVTTLLVLLALGAIAAFLFWRRRKFMLTAQARAPTRFEAGSASQNPFEETGSHILSITSFINSSSSAPHSPDGLSTISPSRLSVITPASLDRRQLVNDTESVHSADSGTGSGLPTRSPGRPALNGFPTASVRRSAKEIEAGLPTSISMDSEYYTRPEHTIPAIGRSQSAAVTTGGVRAVERTVRLPTRSVSLGGPEIIIQHEDAGTVRELPPPYADRH
ncbi:unnamed protein product [Mycena citricolor]|uniref:Uncharacterized protein n=1 Tax=Mycena citricolor TaxID=2018698 RepID=A0AAD2HLC7_9AGAR|nr:unnamed protein product [Mycena citricolor]CAK5278032.1 unnamed protein product [Mycena citricolor]CAK5278777.1 unnamed protein product [Mycena citricolor]